MDAVLRIELDRPQRGNALDAALVERLHAAMDAADSDPPRCLVLVGAGRHFCTGFDLDAVDAESAGDVLLRFVRIEALLQRIFHAPFLTVALVHGKALGAGADLLSACAIRIAAPDSIFAFPGLRFGVLLGTRRLVCRVGAEAARSLLIGARAIGVARALELGLVQRSVAADEWPRVIEQIAADHSSLSPSAAASILRITAPDTRCADMAAVVGSASDPGFRNRLLGYRAAVRGARAAVTAESAG